MDDPVIRYSWTNSRVRKLAYRVARSMPVGVITLPERQDAAYFAMVTKLYQAHNDGDPEPTSTWLWNWGRQAISKTIETELREHGYSTKTSGPMRGYFTWWAGPHQTRDEQEDRIIEPIAVRQILDGLPYRDRRVLEALAEHGHITIAAEQIGWTVAYARERLTEARKEARRMWNYPDPPARQWANDPPIGSGPMPIGEYLADRRRKRKAA